MAHLCWRDMPPEASAPQSSAVQQAGPNITSDYFVRAVANQLVQQLRGDAAVLCSFKPDADVFKSLIRLAWASSSGEYKLLTAPWEELGSIPLAAANVQYQENEYCEDMQLCR